MAPLSVAKPHAKTASLQVYLQACRNYTCILQYAASKISDVTDPKELRQELRKSIQSEFLRLKDEHRGALELAAKEIGVDRQQMQQWAKGVPVPADVLLMALMKWGSVIRIDEPHSEGASPRRWEFSMSGKDRELQKPRLRPVQLSLLDALNDFQEENVQVRVLKKGPGRLELGLEIGFKRAKS